MTARIWERATLGLRKVAGATLACLLVVASCAESGAVGPPAPGEKPRATAVRVTQMGDLTRLSVELSQPVAARAFPMTDPDRIVVDLPETTFLVDPVQGAPAGRSAAARRSAREQGQGSLIAAYRFGLLEPGRSRIVIDLAGAARIVETRSTTGPGGGAVLHVDLARSDRISFVASALEQARAPLGEPKAASLPAPAADRDSRIVVVIDPGHGGIDIGAQGPGRVVEKEIVFEFALALARRLEESRRYRAVLTRTEDVFVPLGERVRLARAANAQLFVSIHADILNEGGVSGATVYTVSDRASDAHAARLAEKENLADKAAGFDGRETAGEISDILFDLTRRETRAYSHIFARTLVSVWKEAARLNKNPLRSAGFKVLQAPDVPSVLLELGYLSSQKDSQLLMDPEWRAKTAGAVARAIDRFFEMRSPAPDGVDELDAAAVQ